MNVYLATSWKNESQPYLVEKLRAWGHGVYDFRNPATGVPGFSWSSVDPNWENWSVAQYRESLDHSAAVLGYVLDKTALVECDVCVLALPSGRSAAWELGYAMGLGKRGVVYMPEPLPELMFSEATIVKDLAELKDVLS